MNVTEIIRELKMTKDEFFPLANELGFDIGERAIKVDDRIAVRLIKAIKTYHKRGTRKSLFEHEQTDKADAAKDEAAEGKPVIEVTNPITTKAFAEALQKPVTDVIAVLVRNGIMATINQNLDFETVSIITEDLGYTAKLIDSDQNNESEIARETKLQSALAKDTGKALSDRPPVIVVVGHVDHGKTSLLDTIRTTEITKQEAGGITQSIGAYQIHRNKRDLTFIDTPGHEAFTAMRARGANIADLAILVVAADDGIKPQTVEAIEILEKAKLPFVVAINKMDKPEADIDKVKKQLSELNLVPEDWGGKTICVPVSAKAKTNIDGLLEMVLLLADLNKDAIQANPKRDAVGTIIESRIDKDAGPVATVLIQTGTLRVGDIVEVGTVMGKIKAMKSWKGDLLKAATPSTPVQFLGLKGAPVVGDILTVANDKKALHKHKKNYQTFGYLQSKSEHSGVQKNKLLLIIKADTLGSLEAVVEALHKIQHTEVEIEIVKRGLGNFTEKDIDQAVGSKAELIGFNVQVTPAAADYALGTQTQVESFDIIYKLLEHVEERLGTLLSPEVRYNKIGELKVLAVFRSTTKFSVIGGRVQKGLIKAKTIAKIVRNGETVGEAKIEQVKSGQQDVAEVTNGHECGVRVAANIPVVEQDIVEIYETEERARSLK